MASLLTISIIFGTILVVTILFYWRLIRKSEEEQKTLAIKHKILDNINIFVSSIQKQIANDSLIQKKFFTQSKQIKEKILDNIEVNQEDFEFLKDYESDLLNIVVDIQNYKNKDKQLYKENLEEIDIFFRRLYEIVIDGKIKTS